LSEITLLTGPFLSGKTSFCLEFSLELKDRGKDVRGIISLAEFEGGKKARIWARDLESGERKLFARKEGEGLAIPQLSPWVFDRKAISWVNSRLEEAIPCDVLIVDELGPLEFQFHDGFQAAFKTIGSQSFKLALVVVRPELLNLALKCWTQASILKIEEVHRWGLEILQTL
jgi:nucleoside-triphosphatase THEP1